MEHDDFVSSGGDGGVEATLDRLEASFGREPIEALLIRFADSLDGAVAALDRGDGRALAHRVAGSAGTLGFPALGRCWLAVADGVSGAAQDARAGAEAARALIARRLARSKVRATSD